MITENSTDAQHGFDAGSHNRDIVDYIAGPDVRESRRCIEIAVATLQGNAGDGPMQSLLNELTERDDDDKEADPEAEKVRLIEMLQEAADVMPQ